jgi:hypothetical protein
MGRSIRVCIVEKNRWWGKALLTASHESKGTFGLSGLAPSLASQLPLSFVHVNE